MKQLWGLFSTVCNTCENYSALSGTPLRTTQHCLEQLWGLLSIVWKPLRTTQNNFETPLGTTHHRTVWYISENVQHCLKYLWWLLSIAGNTSEDYSALLENHWGLFRIIWNASEDLLALLGTSTWIYSALFETLGLQALLSNVWNISDDYSETFETLLRILSIVWTSMRTTQHCH